MDGHLNEPFEEAVVELPEAHVGAAVDLLGQRKGTMQDLSNSEGGLTRLTYRIPTRSVLTASHSKSQIFVYCRMPPNDLTLYPPGLQHFTFMHCTMVPTNFVQIATVSTVMKKSVQCCS